MANQFVFRGSTPSAPARLDPALTQSSATLQARQAVLASSDLRFIPQRSGPAPSDIAGASPLTGISLIRNITIADRLRQPQAQESRDYATATRSATLTALAQLAADLSREDGELPGLFQGVNVYGLEDDPFLKEGADAPPATQRFRPFAHFVTIAGGTASLRGELFTKVNALPTKLLQSPSGSGAAAAPIDEGLHFSTGVDLGDNSVALLRQMEGRIKTYRDIITLCQSTLQTLRGNQSAVSAALQAAETDIAEARHDTATALALEAEEEARLAAINARRRLILDSEVRFLAYLRPREADNLLPAPRRALDPGLVAAPVPECLRNHGEVPAELQQLLAVVREAPASWFLSGGPLLDRLDQVALLGRALQAAQSRSIATVQTTQSFSIASGDRLADALARVNIRQTEVVRVQRAQVQQIDLARFVALGWQNARAQADAVLSFGDLIDGQHGRHDLARNAAREFAQIGDLCTCLHTEFCGVLPAIRLVWADTLGEYDTTPSLRNLAGLPRWNEIGYIDRRRMQAYVDWLFSQLRPGNDDAIGLINDVVHACLLLASHAPVDRIIAGRLPRPVVARPGVRIPLTAFDPSRLRIGMHALVYRGDQIVARAVVEDLGSSEHSARVIETRAASEQLDTQLRVHFAEAASVSALRLRR